MKSDKKSGSYAVLALMLVLLLAASAVAVRLTDLSDAVAAVNLLLSVVTASLTVLLYFFCINGFAWDRREQRLFQILVTVFFLTDLPVLLAGGIEGRPQMHRLTMLLYTFLYVFSALYWLAFWLFQKGKYPHRFGEKVCESIHLVFWGVYILLVAVNHFTGFCFTVNADGSFVVRSYLIYGLTVLWFILYFILAMTMQCDIKTKLTLASYSLFPLLNWLLIPLVPDLRFYLDIFSSLGLFFYLIPLYLLFFNVYLESGRLFLQRERELEESRANAMMLKISPHFIANTMSSIVALCYADAPKAGELASSFAVYLRDNYADMSENAMIPFSKELEHIRNYLAVEVIRFPGLRVEYDIREKAFLIPTLTVQPLVENAVRHGISKRPDASGTVKIASLADENCYIIRISDDGAGFDTTASRDGKHIGIANAKARLHMLCDGTLTIKSRRGEGTLCEIRIPKEACRK